MCRTAFNPGVALGRGQDEDEAVLNDVVSGGRRRRTTLEVAAAH